METIRYLATTYGVNFLAFFTVTFPDPQPSPQEAARRMNSLNTHVLSKRYRAWLCVYERGGKNKKPHFHLIVVLANDIRTGCDFAAIDRGDYKSAPQALRDEWDFWRATTNYNGRRAHLAPYADIGRTELMPVKSTADGIRKYVGKYIEKHMGCRLPEDKGVRLLRMSKGLSRMTVNFGWHSSGAALFRIKLQQWSEARGIPTYGHLNSVLGPKWAYRNRKPIMEWVIDWARVKNNVRVFVTQNGPQVVDLRFWDELDRMNLAKALRTKTGCAIEAAYEYYCEPCMSPEKLGMMSRIVSGEPF